MNTQIGKSIGIALLLAAGLLAALFAMGVFSATGVNAEHTTCMEDGQITPKVTCAQLSSAPTITGQGNGNVLAPTFLKDVHHYTLKVANDSTIIDISTKVDNGAMEAIITPVDSNDDATDNKDTKNTDESKHNINLTDGYVDAITIEVKNDPDKEPNAGGTTSYIITLEYDSPTNSTTAGAAVRLTLEASLEADEDDDIVINLSGFEVPSDIDTDDISISNNDNVADPTDVISGNGKITLVVPDMDGAGKSGSPGLVLVDPDGKTTTTIIRISNKAGITNPTKAGMYGITIDAKDADDDADSNDGQNVAEVIRTISIDPASGPGGSDVKITGKGFSDGTATVYIDKTPAKAATTDPTVAASKAKDEANDKFDPTDPVIGTVSISDGMFTLTTDALKEDAIDSDIKMVKVNAVDGNGDRAKTSATYTFNPGFTIEPEKVSWGEEITITTKDWTAGDITEVRFGGSGGEKTDAEDGSVANTFTTDVPTGLRAGKLTVEVFTASGLQSSSAIIEIEPLSLTITPSSVVPGQQITIRGSGFLSDDEVDDIMIGGEEADLPDASDRNVTSAGRIAVTTDVPLAVGNGEKKVIVKVGGREGNANITVPKPSITVDPEESLIGSTITVSGTGFAASERVEVLYGGEIEDVGKADSNGNVNVELTVPSDAGIGETNPVKVRVRAEESINASADHKTPGSVLTSVSSPVQAGGEMTVSGINFQGFSTLKQVTVGGYEALPSPAPETDRKGQFEFQVRVPLLSVGNHTVTVVDGNDNSATETFRVSVEPVVEEPVVTDPAELFAGLGARLLRVWELDNATQTWSFYDPRPDRADFNSLTEVSSGDIATIIISSGDPIEFQGSNLYSGTNLVALK